MRRIGLLLVGLVAALAACSATTPGPPPRSATSARLSSVRNPVATTTPTAARPTTNPRTSPPTASATKSDLGTPLPLRYRTGAARQVITVVAARSTSTRARLQAWRRVGARWRRVGPSVPAWLGYQGYSEPAAEGRTATPTGSYTLTQAFGADPDPGTRLPYLRTTTADWWISQPGPLYNTLQHCWTSCPFTQGAPNEHLHDELPYYDYAIVIDYNTRNAPGGVRPGRGSAFFLHVTVRQPTQGCVSIPKAQLVRILRWLRPRDHPRILLGVPH